MKQLKLDKLQTEFFIGMQHMYQERLIPKPKSDGYLVIQLVLKELFMKPISLGSDLTSKIRIRESQAAALRFFLLGMPINDLLADVTRNNLIEKLTHLYHGK